MVDRRLSRRHLFRTGAHVAVAAAAATAVGCAVPAPGAPSNPAFAHGVASGDPHHDSVVIWTRRTPEHGSDRETARLRWEVATRPDMADVIASGEVATSAERDWTASAVVDGLEAATTLYYRWSDGELHSPVGRTKTAPRGAAAHLRFAVVSCSNYAYGYFHNYAAIAQRHDLDAVIHLGDYIYEYANVGAGETYGTFRGNVPAHEITTLSDYRQRYGCYRLDPDLAELHRQHPIIHVWDDHEFADDPVIGGAANHQPWDGPWDDRVDAALQAYREWMPTRLVGNRIYRTIEYGDLVRLVMIDRQRRFLWPEPDDTDAYLDTAQFSWLEDRLAETDQTWTVLVQQSTFGATSSDRVGGGWGKQNRDRVATAFEAGRSTNLVVLTGDIHRAHAIELVQDPSVYRPGTGNGTYGVEFSCGSVTSPGGDGSWFGDQVRWSHGSSRTYLILDVTPDGVQADAFGFPDLYKYLAGRPDDAHLMSWRSESGSAALHRAATPAPGYPGAAPA